MKQPESLQLRGFHGLLPRWEEFPEQTAYYLKDNPDCLHGVEYEGDLEALEVVSPPRVDTLIGYVVRHTFFEKDPK